jgi:predicted acetyltransferase
MDIELESASKSALEVVQNLARFYVYDMSRSCGLLPGWEVPSNGLYECKDLSRYWTEPNRYPFLIKVDGELAGFALINNKGTTPDVDWDMGEFFVIAKFQGKGVGRHAAEKFFDQFPGIWEVRQMVANQPAIDFWRRVIESYTHGQFTSETKPVGTPVACPMVVLKFQTSKSSAIKSRTL